MFNSVTDKKNNIHDQWGRTQSWADIIILIRQKNHCCLENIISIQKGVYIGGWKSRSGNTAASKRRTWDESKPADFRSDSSFKLTAREKEAAILVAKFLTHSSVKQEPRSNNVLDMRTQCQTGKWRSWANETQKQTCLGAHKVIELRGSGWR